jgi:sulfate transport system ATP-binding protein
MAAPRRIARSKAEEGGDMSTTIEIKNISRNFGQHTVLSDVNLAVEPGELLALLGPSGSGKTTLLRLIAGLDFPDAGIIKFDKDDALGRKPKERGVGFVFQHYALFRHMTVFENVAFALRVRRAPKAEVTERVNALLKLIQLETLAGRYPAQLSGGQRQRVALARALAIQPRVLLLDEPFGALDAVVRRDLRRWLRNQHEEMNITTLFVTHDQEEAFELADRVVIMNGGKIIQQGTPIGIYRAPADAFVHEFLGESNKFPCIIKSGLVHAVNGETGFPIGTADAPNGEATAYIRPHHVLIRPNARAGWTVSRVTSTGAQARVNVTLGSITAESIVTADAILESGLAEGNAVDVTFTGGTLFDANGKNPIKISALKPSLAQLGTGTR